MDIYDTRELVGVIQVQKPPELYWLNFFTRELTFRTMDIQFDIVAPHRRLAPFVAPNVQGRVQRRFGHTAKTFRPAYIKSKHSLDPSATIPRLAGERLGGEYTTQQREDALIAENMRLEKEGVMRRWEWMAARALIDGSVTVEGDDYPPVTVAFGRNAALSSTLLTTARWSQTTSTPLADIETMRRQSWELANAPIDRLTLGLNAWASFSNHADIRPLLNTLTRGSSTEFNIAVPAGAPYQYMGFLAGQGGIGRLDLYTYNSLYEDDTGTLQPFMDQDTVVGTGTAIEGVQCFGAIRDFDSMEAVSMFPKMWKQPDPSELLTMTQSAPLMVPGQPDGSFKIKVQ